MPRLPKIGSDKIIKILLHSGFYVYHQRGSHINFRHETKTHLRVVVPSSRRELAPKTLKSIMAQSELTAEDLKD